MALDHLRIFALGNALGGYHCEPGRMPKARFLDKGVLALINLFVFIFIQIILALAVFHLTDVDDFVCPFNDDINLCSRYGGLASPGIVESGDGIYTQSVLNLLDMSHTDTFIGQPHPGIDFRRVDVVSPILLFYLSPVDESKIEKAEEVAKLIDGVFSLNFFFTYNILSNQVAIDKVFQPFA